MLLLHYIFSGSLIERDCLLPLDDIDTHDPIHEQDSLKLEKEKELFQVICLFLFFHLSFIYNSSHRSDSGRNFISKVPLGDQGGTCKSAEEKTWSHSNVWIQIKHQKSQTFRDVTLFILMLTLLFIYRIYF